MPSAGSETGIFPNDNPGRGADMLTGMPVGRVDTAPVGSSPHRFLRSFLALVLEPSPPSPAPGPATVAPSPCPGLVSADIDEAEEDEDDEGKEGEERLASGIRS